MFKQGTGFIVCFTEDWEGIKLQLQVADLKQAKSDTSHSTLESCKTL